MYFLDSKTLTADTRSTLLNTLDSDPENLAWSVRVIRLVCAYKSIGFSQCRVSPQAISCGMLRRPPTNLNRQSEDATILLIREVLSHGIELSEACLMDQQKCTF